MAPVTDMEINIPLATLNPKEVGQKEDMYKLIHDSYTSQYLELLGVEPRPHYQRLVARQAPLAKCEVEAGWDDISAVARKLTITQVPASERSRPQGGPQAGGASGSPTRQLEAPTSGVDRWRIKEVSPPHVPDAEELTKSLGLGLKSGTMQPPGHDPRLEAFRRMDMVDHAASENASRALVLELERLRRSARGETSSGDEEFEPIKWGEEGLAELHDLKSKFILPFAAASGRFAGKDPEPWQSDAYQKVLPLTVRDQHQSEMSRPISMLLEDILEETVNFTQRRLPLELLTTRKDSWYFAALRERLVSPDAIRMIGLLAHLLYWLLFGFLRPEENRLPQSSRQSLILSLQDLWSKHIDPVQHRRPSALGQRLAKEPESGISFLIPVQLLSIKCGVEMVFRKQYPQTFADVHSGEKLMQLVLEQLNILVMNLFDPDCAHASFGAFDSSIEAMKLWRKLRVAQMKLGVTPATRMIGREFRTSPLLLLMMHGGGHIPTNPKTRQLLAKSFSTAVLDTVSAAPLKQASPKKRALAKRLPTSKSNTSVAIAAPELQEAKQRASKGAAEAAARSASGQSSQPPTAARPGSGLVGVPIWPRPALHFRAPKPLDFEGRSDCSSESEDLGLRLSRLPSMTPDAAATPTIGQRGQRCTIIVEPPLHGPLAEPTNSRTATPTKSALSKSPKAATPLSGRCMSSGSNGSTTALQPQFLRSALAKSQNTPTPMGRSSLVRPPSPFPARGLQSTLVNKAKEKSSPDKDMETREFLDEHQQKVLYRTACKRMAFVGQEIVEAKAKALSNSSRSRSTSDLLRSEDSAEATLVAAAGLSPRTVRR